tara:strand:- start:571 stop:1200 length:630 start_codon:yes stop_codon:yes gene_type:complete
VLLFCIEQKVDFARARLKFKDARLEKSNASILDAALVAFAENPDTTFTEISKIAGVGRATLYRMYATRESLIEALLLKCLDKLDVEMSKAESNSLSLKHFFELFFITIINLENEYKLMLKLDLEKCSSEAVRKRCSKQEQEMEELVESAKHEGLIDKNTPTKWVIHLIDGLIYSSWEFNSSQNDSTFVAKMATKSLLTGVGKASFFGKK